MCSDCRDFRRKRHSRKENGCLAGNRKNVQMSEENGKESFQTQKKQNKSSQKLYDSLLEHSKCLVSR